MNTSVMGAYAKLYAGQGRSLKVVQTSGGTEIYSLGMAKVDRSVAGTPILVSGVSAAAWAADGVKPMRMLAEEVARMSEAGFSCSQVLAWVLDMVARLQVRGQGVGLTPAIVMRFLNIMIATPGVIYGGVEPSLGECIQGGLDGELYPGYAAVLRPVSIVTCVRVLGQAPLLVDFARLPVACYRSAAELRELRVVRVGEELRVTRLPADDPRAGEDIGSVYQVLGLVRRYRISGSAGGFSSPVLNVPGLVRERVLCALDAASRIGVTGVAAASVLSAADEMGFSNGTCYRAIFRVCPTVRALGPWPSAWDLLHLPAFVLAEPEVTTRVRATVSGGSIHMASLGRTQVMRLLAALVDNFDLVPKVATVGEVACMWRWMYPGHMPKVRADVRTELRVGGEGVESVQGSLMGSESTQLMVEFCRALREATEYKPGYSLAEAEVVGMVGPLFLDAVNAAALDTVMGQYVRVGQACGALMCAVDEQDGLTRPGSSTSIAGTICGPRMKVMSRYTPHWVSIGQFVLVVLGIVYRRMGWSCAYKLCH